MSKVLYVGPQMRVKVKALRDRGVPILELESVPQAREEVQQNLHVVIEPALAIAGIEKLYDVSVLLKFVEEYLGELILLSFRDVSPVLMSRCDRVIKEPDMLNRQKGDIFLDADPFELSPRDWAEKAPMLYPFYYILRGRRIAKRDVLLKLLVEV